MCINTEDIIIKIGSWRCYSSLSSEKEANILTCIISLSLIAWLIFSLLSITVLLTGVLYNIEISVSNNLCYFSSKLDGGSGLEGLFSVIDEGLFRNLETGNSQMALVEGLRLVELVAVLSANLVSV